MTRPTGSDEFRVILLDIVRFAYAPFGTYGRCTARFQESEIPTLRSWWTVERPWLENAPFVSCIPEGSYTCKREVFHRKQQETLEIQFVQDRTEILIHVANWPNDVQGCIGIGTDVMGNSPWGVANSGDAMKELHTLIYKDYPSLDVRVQVRNAIAGLGVLNR